MQGFYNRTTTFSADFTQQYMARAYNTTKTSNGHVIFSKPGKMDWEYTDPKDNRIVSDGSKLRVYEAANKQMYEQTVDQSQYPAALSFLTGQGSLDSNFTFEIKPEMNFQGGFVLIGTPKTVTPAYTKVLFYVDSGTSQVLRVLIWTGSRIAIDSIFERADQSDDRSGEVHVQSARGTTIVHPELALGASLLDAGPRPRASRYLRLDLSHRDSLRETRGFTCSRHTCRSRLCAR